jgi:hypothetical protein
MYDTGLLQHQHSKCSDQRIESVSIFSSVYKPTRNTKFVHTTQIERILFVLYDTKSVARHQVCVSRKQSSFLTSPLGANFVPRAEVVPQR